MLPARLRLALVAFSLCAVAAVIGATLASRGSGSPTGLELSADGWAGAIRPPGQRVPDFTLTDQDGNTVTSAQLEGHGPIVYAFVYSTCEDVCPAQVQTIKGALDDSGREDVKVVGISVDPANDTRKRAASFLLKQGMTGRMEFLLGTRAQLQPVWDAFAIQPQKGNLEHTSHTVLADARGFHRIGFPFDRLTEDGLAHDLAKLEAR